MSDVVFFRKSFRITSRPGALWDIAICFEGNRDEFVETGQQ